MSSSTLIEKISKLGSSGIFGALGSIGSFSVGALKLGTSPVTAGGKGLVEVGRFLIYTTLGRAIVLVCVLWITFKYFQHHFTAVESMQWKTAVAEKQAVVVKKVATVNAETRQAQAIARNEVGAWDKILAVVSSGIWKVEKPDPVEAETVDLINETRGKRQ